MISIAIISVLISLAIPQFNHYRTRANDSTAAADASISAKALAIALKN
ncbi:Tfp structural protein [Stutzerimonas stutzeri]|nr:Tfp structural protein [Stutzerimonas stutzeri]